MERINIQSIIKKITPLYNQYKQSSKTISGTAALYIMWDIGDILKRSIDSSDIPPHNLYRKIYGKSEGNTNIVQNSYVTREFLGRSYRIRNIFSNRGSIEEKLPNLKKFILFREAMPFFDNKKYVFKDEDMVSLLKLLNGNESSSVILSKIKILQSKKIGITNPRDQKFAEMESKKQTFVSFYNYLFNIIDKNDYGSAIENFSELSSKTLVDLSSITSALTQEGLLFQDVPEEKFDESWIPYVELLSHFSSQKDPKERRRFRRLVSPVRIMKLAEMLQAISSENSFKNFKNE